MKLNYFFRASWMFQLLVGVGLFSVSFLIESQLLQAFLPVPLLAIALALFLEVGKATAIIWHRYMSGLSPQGYSWSTHFASGAFRGGLVLLSLVCSLLYLANHLDRPHLETVRKDQLSAVQQRLDSQLAGFDADWQQRSSQLKTRQQTEYQDVKQRYVPRIQYLQDQLNEEMNHVVNGVFRGARYQEFERLLAEESSARNLALEQLAQQHFIQSNALKEALSLDTQRSAALTAADQQRMAIQSNDFATDERVNDSRIVAFLQMIDSVFDLQFEPLQFVFVFSILLSVLMEIGIILAFDTVSTVMLPVLRAQQEARVKAEIFKAQMAEAVDREDMQHESVLQSVNRRARRSIQEAEDIADAHKD